MKKRIGNEGHLGSPEFHVAGNIRPASNRKVSFAAQVVVLQRQKNPVKLDQARSTVGPAQLEIQNSKHETNRDSYPN
jgi:hypothetical protein